MVVLGFISDLLCYLLDDYNQQSKKAVNSAQRRLDSYSSKYDSLPDEGKAKYDKLQSQINRAERKCTANERKTEKYKKSVGK